MAKRIYRAVSSSGNVQTRQTEREYEAAVEVLSVEPTGEEKVWRGESFEYPKYRTAVRHNPPAGWREAEKLARAERVRLAAEWTGETSQFVVTNGYEESGAVFWEVRRIGMRYADEWFILSFHSTYELAEKAGRTFANRWANSPIRPKVDVVPAELDE